MSNFGQISVKFRSNMKILTSQLNWKPVRNFRNFRNSSNSVGTEIFCSLNPKTLDASEHEIRCARAGATSAISYSASPSPSLPCSHLFSAFESNHKVRCSWPYHAASPCRGSMWARVPLATNSVVVEAVAWLLEGSSRGRLERARRRMWGKAEEASLPRSRHRRPPAKLRTKISLCDVLLVRSVTKIRRKVWETSGAGWLHRRSACLRVPRRERCWWSLVSPSSHGGVAS